MSDGGRREPGIAVVMTQARMAFVCVLLAVLGGAVSVLHYIPACAPVLNDIGLTLPKLRPLHTTFASLWIFGAAIAVVYHYLATTGDGLSGGDRRRFRFHTWCWIGAGVGIFVSLGAGVSSGREYLGFHPLFSVPLLIGWFAFAWSFLRRVLAIGFWNQPVYIWFWTTGTLYFIYTFTEGHAYLLPWVQDYPVRDLQLQWKSCGTLVGSFNFLVYGCLIYAGERLSGDKRYGQSSIAFWLFGVGCLNSFTNYVHHTYHLPQSHTAKWIAFVVSMLEIVILLRLMIDLRRMLRTPVDRAQYCAVSCYFKSAKWWTAVMLFTSLLISVPNLNSIVHGTHAVVGHAMGTELGIDTMVLLGAITYVLSDALRDAPGMRDHLHHGCTRRHVVLLNVSAAVLVTWLTVSGTVHGWHRFHGEIAPDWVAYGREILFPLAGGGVGLGLVLVFRHFAGVLFGRPAPGPSAGEAAPTT